MSGLGCSLEAPKDLPERCYTRGRLLRVPATKTLLDFLPLPSPNLPMLFTVVKNPSQCHRRPLERARRGKRLRLHLVNHWPRPADPQPLTQTCGPTLET